MSTNKFTVNWRNILFFGSVHLGALIVIPIYIYNFGFTLSDYLLFLFWSTATGLAITIGYHRLFAHRTFKSHPVVTFLALFFGAAAFEESALEWAAQHRDHHKYVDTERDPYNIKEGFWYAHIGWILFRSHYINYDNVKDLSSHKIVAHQNQHYFFWAIMTGIVLPALSGFLIGNIWSGIVFGVFGRITFVHHGTFLINSACHYFGRPNYDFKSSAKDHWMIALFTGGEGYHSFHHRFPSDYRNGYQWYHFDPSKWLINVFAWFGLTKDLKRVSDFTILAARLSAERELAELYLAKHPHSAQNDALKVLKDHYEHLKDILHKWEQHVTEHAALYSQLQNKSDELLRAAFKRVQTAKKQFSNLREQWVRLIPKPSLISLAIKPA